MNPYTIPLIENEIKLYQSIIAHCVAQLGAPGPHQEAEDLATTARQIGAGAALAKLTDSLETLRRMQDDDATNSQE